MTPLSFPSLRIPRAVWLRSEIGRLMTTSILFSCLLVSIRIFHTGRWTFIWMIWNLFLAYVPYGISSWLTAGEKRRTTPVIAICAAVWLLFIPNSFYILTDLFHLADGHRNTRIPEWFDLALILSFAWNGLLLGILSIRQIEKFFFPRTSAVSQWLFLYPVMFLNALGVYIGRFLRYNSWDIVVNPFQLLRDMFEMTIHPLHHHYAWDMILCFSILLTLMYMLLKKGSKSLV